MNRKQWFIDRIGKRVYRGMVSCPCESCQKAGKEGLVISDNDHANYLYDRERELGLKYYDSLEEVKNNKNETIQSISKG